MKNSSIAVLIASYNAERFLDVTLQGIAWQTLSATEVIIVDDCSTDETSKVIEKWSDCLPIRYLRNERNLGVGASRNVGLRLVQSSLVAILDADDLWLPEHLQTLFNCFRSERTIVSPRAVVWGGGIGISEDHQYALDVPKGEDQFKLLCRENFVFSGSMFPKSMVHEVNDYPSVRVGEDHLLWLKAVASGYVIVKPKTATVLYRRHEGSLSEVKSDFFKSLQYAFLECLGLFTIDQQKLVRRHIKDLRMRELLSSHDERTGGFVQSIFKNLVPVIARGSLRLKLSAIARILLIVRTPFHQ